MPRLLPAAIQKARARHLYLRSSARPDRLWKKLYPAPGSPASASRGKRRLDSPAWAWPRDRSAPPPQYPHTTVRPHAGWSPAIRRLPETRSLKRERESPPAGWRIQPDICRKCSRWNSDTGLARARASLAVAQVVPLAARAAAPAYAVRPAAEFPLQPVSSNGTWPRRRPATLL